MTFPIAPLLIGLAALASSSGPAVKLLNGTVEGFHLGGLYDQDLFLGIPYAQPPLGPLRWAQPQSINRTFGGVLHATSYSPSCPGYGTDDVGVTVAEDCLTLNVIRPSSVASNLEKLPVAVWIHGGGYFSGGSQDKRYNLTFIVDNAAKIKKPFIAVSMNYRLSAWGFLGSQELAAEGASNLGLRDQRLALHWVQENIDKFGGDAARVTIWGESAGAGSVGSHLIAYTGRDDKLFNAAVMESGGTITFSSQNSTSGLQPLYDQIAFEMGCSGKNSLKCLRSLPFDNLNEYFTYSDAVSNTKWTPNLDGDFLCSRPSDALRQGAFVKVPILAGTNSDEGTSASPLYVETTEDFRSDLLAFGLMPPQVDELLKLYPDDPCFGEPLAFNCTVLGGHFGAQYRRSAAYWGDYEFIAQRRLQSQTFAKHSLPVYAYRFNVRPHGVELEAGVGHFAEVAFVFYNLQGLGYDTEHGTYPPFEDEPPSFEQVSREMSYSWISFFVDHDVNSWRGAYGKGGKYGKSKGWPRYVLDKDGVGQNFVWDANVTSHAEVDDWRKDGIAYINDHAADIYGR